MPLISLPLCRPRSLCHIATLVFAALVSAGCGGNSASIDSGLPATVDDLIATYTKAYESGDGAAIRKLFVQGSVADEDLETFIGFASMGMGKNKIVESEIRTFEEVKELVGDPDDVMEFGYPPSRFVQLHAEPKEALPEGVERSLTISLPIGEGEGKVFFVAGRQK